MSIIVIVRNQEEQSSILEFERYKRYCDNRYEKPFDQKVLSQYVEELKSGELVACDCCGDVWYKNRMSIARYDNKKLVCDMCKSDGN